MTMIHFLHLHFFYIFTLYLCLKSSFIFAMTQEECESGDGKVRTAGTGTVLFNPTDVYKICWSQEEIAILTARLILEDVIPDPKMVSIQCNEEIDDLVEYFKVVIETIRSNTKARKRHIMLMALTDLLGGYLHHAILPMARKAYYAGAVDYSYMEKLIQLYEELKWFLRTNGQGWTKPLVINKEVRVPTIEIGKPENSNQNESCCHKLLFFEHEPVKTRKRAINTEKGIYFPLPFFDAKYRPTAIVIPLKRFALRNIESKRAAYAIMKYFISAEQCLKEKNAKPDMFQRFHNNLYTWIDKEVIPKLNDDKFYSAFGGILRVQNTLKALGSKIGPVTCNTDEGEEEVGAIPAVGCSSHRNKIILVAILLVIIAWFLIGTCFICYRMKNGSGKKTDKMDKTKTSKQESSTSFSSSKWSSILSRSSSKTSKSTKQLCKCCESTISEKSTAGYTSTSEYDSEKTRKKEKRKPKSFGPSNKKTSQSSPCVCPNIDGPAVIDTKHSMKVLPSIAEMSENSLSRDKNGSLKKISFADESGISSSDGGIRICVPPWVTPVPCTALSDKSTNYSSSRSVTTKSQAVPDSNISDVPIASSTRREPHGTAYEQQMSTMRYNTDETSNNFNQSYSKDESRSANQLNNTSSIGYTRNETPNNSNQSYPNDDSKRTNQLNETRQMNSPLANSTFRYDPAETTNEYGTTNTPGEESFGKASSNSITKHVSTTGTIEQYSYNDEEEKPDQIKQEVKKEPEDRTYYDYHMSACHSSISGNYDLFHKPDPNKPYIFGYDFQTSTSSDMSDDDDSKY